MTRTQYAKIVRQEIADFLQLARRPTTPTYWRRIYYNYARDLQAYAAWPARLLSVVHEWHNKALEQIGYWEQMYEHAREHFSSFPMWPALKRLYDDMIHSWHDIRLSTRRLMEVAEDRYKQEQTEAMYYPRVSVYYPRVR